MIEGAIECVRRGFQSFLAIWPLLLVRLAEMVVVAIVMVGGFLLALIPAGVSLDFDDIHSWIDDPEGVAGWFLSNIGFIFYVVIAVCLLLGVAVLIHSYFEAGIASLYLDHMRSGASFSWREAWDRFSLDAFTQAALARGWSVFLVYNIVWGVAGAVLLIPLGLMLAVQLIFRDSPAAIVFTCFGLVVVAIVGIITSIIAAVWGQVAVTLAAGERRGPMESSSRAGDLLRARLGVTILAAIIVYAVTFGFSSVTSTLNFGLGALGQMPGAETISLAFQAVLFVVNSVVSTVLGLWSAAVWTAFVATAGTPPRRVASASSGGNGGTGNALVG